MAQQIQGLIYKIYNISEPDKFYIGGTTQSLPERLYDHKRYSNVCNSFFYQEVNRLGWNNFQIKLIEDYPCDSKEDLRRKEDQYITQLNPYYNTRRAFLTEQDLKEQIVQYRADHKEQIVQYRADHKEQIAQYKAQYYADHKEQRAEQYREKICKSVLDDLITRIENA